MPLIAEEVAAQLTNWLCKTNIKPPSQTLTEKLVGLAQAVIVSISKTIFPTFNRQFVQEFKDQAAVHCIDETLFTDPEVSAKVKDFKEAWSHSPETPADIGNDLLKLISGRTSQMQLESILGTQLGSNLPVTNRLFANMGFMTDGAALSSVLSVIGEVASIGQIDTIGREMRAYYDYSGLSQITGYGYGMLLSNMVTPLVTQEVNSVVQPNLLSVGEMQNALNRGFISIDQFNSDLRKMGYSPEKVATLTKQCTYQPTAPDVVRFAVREVFTPEVAAAYGQYDDYPSQFTEEARKAGLDEENAKRYWAAHWELPSLTMGYEMFHRRIITADQLQMLMRAQDVMPYWRPLLTKLSYHPLTRVDVRRMYQAGALTEQQVYDSYLDVGYSPENAAAMLEWTKKAYAKTTTAGKAFVVGQIESSYKVKDIDRGAANKFLLDMRYSQAQADLLLNRWDIEIKETADDNAAAAMQAAYLSGTLSAEAYISRVQGLSISEKKKTAYIKAAKQAKKSVTPSPPISDLNKFLQAQIIGEQTYRDRLKALGYTDEVIGWYVALNSGGN